MPLSKNGPSTGPLPNAHGRSVRPLREVQSLRPKTTRPLTCAEWRGVRLFGWGPARWIAERYAQHVGPLIRGPKRPREVDSAQQPSRPSGSEGPPQRGQAHKIAAPSDRASPFFARRALSRDASATAWRAGGSPSRATPESASARAASRSRAPRRDRGIASAGSPTNSSTPSAWRARPAIRPAPCTSPTRRPRSTKSR